MTNREIRICKAILGVLHDADGGQFEEIKLHEEANRRERMSLSEFNAVLAICDKAGWLTGVPSRFNASRMKWNLNDAGEAALLQL